MSVTVMVKNDSTNDSRQDMEEMKCYVAFQSSLPNICSVSCKNILTVEAFEELE